MIASSVIFPLKYSDTRFPTSSVLLGSCFTLFLRFSIFCLTLFNEFFESLVVSSSLPIVLPILLTDSLIVEIPFSISEIFVPNLPGIISDSSDRFGGLNSIFTKF